MKVRNFVFLSAAALFLMKPHNDELYFTLCLTENEHYIVEGMIEGWCNVNAVRMMYYRKLKAGHIPMQRECKLKGKNLSKFFEFADAEGLDLQNYNRRNI